MSDWKSILAVGVVGFITYKVLKKDVQAGAEAVGDAVDPTSRDNLIYQGVNAVGDIADDGGDNDTFSLGGWFYDLAHPEERP